MEQKGRVSVRRLIGWFGNTTRALLFSIGTGLTYRTRAILACESTEQYHYYRAHTLQETCAAASQLKYQETHRRTWLVYTLYENYRRININKISREKQTPVAQGREITVAEPSRFSSEPASDGSQHAAQALAQTRFYGLFSHKYGIYLDILSYSRLVDFQMWRAKNKKKAQITRHHYTKHREMMENVISSINTDSLNSPRVAHYSKWSCKYFRHISWQLMCWQI